MRAISLAFLLLVVGACRTHEKKDDVPLPPIAPAPVVPELSQAEISAPVPLVPESVAPVTQEQAPEDPELVALEKEVRILDERLAAMKTRRDRIKAQVEAKLGALRHGTVTANEDLDGADLGGDEEDDDDGR
ncbi:hypothetical protein HY625_00390 [Candidatus Uhrbacteria bacterium]|nr:hypothetical protein [Candidatus Uhrbacteria bacterium]